MSAPTDRDPGLIDLVAPALGGVALSASDEYFAPKEHLLDPGPPRFDPHAYTSRGKLMDGWESRRQRTHGPNDADWVVIRLGVPGVVHRIVVDTTHFRGNFPESCALDGISLDDDDPPPRAVPTVDWVPLLHRRQLVGDRVQTFAADRRQRVTHVRLSIYPDGGVARLRLLGEPLPDLRRAVGPGGAVDLAASLSGGAVVASSDAFFSPPGNLIAPGAPVDMGGGWETRRRRGPGHDWTVVRLAAEGHIGRIELDTTHFTGNHPDHCSLEVARASDLAPTGSPPGSPPDSPPAPPPGDAWRLVVEKLAMRPHARHAVTVEDLPPATHVRLGVHPDGGVARLRVLGTVTDDGWRAWGTRWLNTVGHDEAASELHACCASQAWVAGVLARRPFAGFADLSATADAVWDGLAPEDWLEAFAGHPRIGERSPERWASREQAGTRGADARVLADLEEGNRRYQERFGHVFLVCATGLAAEQMLAALHARLANDPEQELRIAAEEQRKITRLRLDKLVRPEP